MLLNLFCFDGMFVEFGMLTTTGRLPLLLRDQRQHGTCEVSATPCGIRPVVRNGHRGASRFPPLLCSCVRDEDRFDPRGS